MGHHYHGREKITLVKKWEEIFNKKGAMFWEDNVSRYAATSHKESFAEVFSVVTAPNYVKGNLPKDIEDIFFKVLKPVKK